MVRCHAALLVFLLPALAGCIGTPEAGSGNVESAHHETVRPIVVAILDFEFNPYHFEFQNAFAPEGSASKIYNESAGPHEWIVDFPAVDSFASYSALNLSLPHEADTLVGCIPLNTQSEIVRQAFVAANQPAGCYDDYESSLHAIDQGEWKKIRQSTADSVHYYHVPGTKIAGYVNMGPGDGFNPGSHGVAVASVAVGNFLGTCPECVLVFVNGPSFEEAEKWARAQPWIDVVSHSYEYSLEQQVGVTRSNIYDCDVSDGLLAAEDGLHEFWGAGNGAGPYAYDIPQWALANCKKGTDWAVTVGALMVEEDGPPPGPGFPVDVAGPGSRVAIAAGVCANCTSTSQGTSLATPIVAGIFAKGLHRLVNGEGSVGTLQDRQIVAHHGVGCGGSNPACPLDDGIVSSHELRYGLLHAAAYSTEGISESTVGQNSGAGNRELLLAYQGYGAFRGLEREIDEAQRMVDEILGTRHNPPEPDVVDWFVSLSFCRQQIWGDWEHGQWQADVPLPQPSPDWPLRTILASDECKTLTETMLARSPTS